MENRSWYLIYTKPRCEQKARQNLADQQFETYLPLFQSIKPKGAQTRALFPNYLFIHLDEKTDNWAPIRSTPGVSRLVRFGQLPARVPDSLIQLLKQNEDPDGYQLMANPVFRKGDKVRVLDGALAGLEAVFGMTKGSDRALVLLDIVGKLTRVELELNRLERA